MATEAEWRHLWEIYGRLPPAVRAGIRDRVKALVTTGIGQADITCPLLDPMEGSCLVYAGRPGACRTYGFYAGREGGQWCGRVEQIARQAPDMIWGNAAAISDQLAALGPTIALTEWFARHGDETERV